METRWSDIRSRATYAPERFTPRFYQDVIAGRPRLDGARAALDHFDVPDAAVRAEEYAERKQQMIVALIEAAEFTAFPDALRFVRALSDRGVRLAAASSSKNAGLILRRIRLGDGPQALGPPLRDLFDVEVSGRDFARGKPDPEIFVTAGSELGIPARECFVVEDAVVGIEAARAAGMVALGVARADDAERLAAAGADLVVTTLDDVALDRLALGGLSSRPA